MDHKTINLLEAAVQKRQALKSCTNVLRLVNGFGDGLKGLVLDQYDRHFFARIFDKRWLLEDMVRAAAAGRRIRKIGRPGQDDDFAGAGGMPESYLAAVLVEM